MTIRLKLLAACLGFALISVALGLFGRVQDGEMADLALNIYDNAFTGIDYAHQAHSGFIRFAAAHAGPATLDEAARAQIGKIIDRVDVTIERASTPKARDAGKAVRAKLVALQAGPIEPAAAITELDTDLGKLVQRYATDGFAYRERADQLVERNDRALLAGIGVAVMLAFGVAIFLERTIVPPVRRAAVIANAVAEGRLDIEIRAKGRSETARLLTALGRMQTALAENLERIQTQTEIANRTADEERQRKQVLETLSRDFSVATSGQLRSVAKAATTLETTAGSLSERSEQTTAVTRIAGESNMVASENARLVAAATEKLVASSGGIVVQVDSTTDITRQAVDASQRAMAMVNELAQVAGGVGQVVEFINAIAAQTNLLALNATIEAARAGAAGKGFAVVAAEVKSLASQTAKATDDIAARIQAVQNAAEQVGGMIREISTVIGEIDDNSSAIAAAVAEQTAATGVISRSVHVATDHIQGVGRNIETVIETTAVAAAASAEVLAAAAQLSREAEQLRQEVESFLNAMVQTSDDRRLVSRINVDQAVIVEFPGARPNRTNDRVAARLLNISSGGAAIEIEAAAEIGDQIHIEGIGASTVKGRIVETSAGRMRVQFLFDADTQKNIEQAIGRLEAA
ncbi:MAG TPA: methyl-accepting chemotaxis protein [Aliidongia sp.]|nr:methyl-accepting chemotaxis protein [Aliidongia sp.]